MALPPSPKTRGGGGDTTTITQTTNNATIDWHSFNIATTETVTFNQPSTTSLAVNNILDTNPSQILGNITANGRIVLLNPNGFYFGTNSSVSAHTFIAAAVSSSNATYNNSTNLLTILDYSSMGDITTLGTINAHTTQLIAHTINTPQGSTINTPLSGYISIRAKKDITIGGTITSPQGTIDIFALNGVATATPTATISTKNDNYDHSLAPGFIEFSGKQFVFEDHSWPFKQNSYDTLLLDPDTITIGSTCTAGGGVVCTTPSATNPTIMANDAPATGTSTILASFLNASTTTGNISLAATNLINVDAPFQSKTNANITLSATNRINVNAAFSAGSGGDITLTTTCTTGAACTAGGIYINNIISGATNLTINSMGGRVSINPIPDNTAALLTATTLTITAGTTVELNGMPTAETNIATGGTTTITAGSNITSNNPANTIGASIIDLSATTGSIGTSANNPISIVIGGATWSDTNLLLPVSSDIYLRTGVTGALTAIPDSFTGSIFSLNQTSGNIDIASAINLPSATIILNASATNPSTINGNIDFDSSAPTITASSLTLAATQNITGTPGTLSAANRINLNGAVSLASGAGLDLETTCTTTGTNACATGDGIYINNDIRLSGPSSGSLTINSMNGLVSIGATDTATTISTGSTSNGISITAGTTVNLNGTSAATATNISSVAFTSITANTGSITSNNVANTITASGLNLTATNGSIGTSANPLTIFEGNPANSFAPGILVGGNIYLESVNRVVLSVIPLNLGSNTFSLNQTAGNIALTSALNFGNANIILNASDTSGTNGNISIGAVALAASSLSLIANGNITGTTGTLTAATGSISLTATTGSIGVMANPIQLTQTATTGTITATSGDNIYLSSTTSALSLGTITAGTAAGDTINIATTVGDITGGTITAAEIALTATNGSIGSAANRTRIRFSSFDRDSSDTSFLATANATNGNVYLSTNNSAWRDYVDEAGRNRMMGANTSIILDPPAVVRKQAKPGGFLSSALDPLLDLFGSGCEKDDVLATVISGFGILCGEE